MQWVRRFEFFFLDTLIKFAHLTQRVPDNQTGRRKSLQMDIKKRENIENLQKKLCEVLGLERADQIDETSGHVTAV